MSLNNYNVDYDPPTLYESLQVAYDTGLVGEEDTVLTVVLSMIRGGLVVMTGPSRAGKDEVVDGAEGAFPAERMIWRWPVDDSPTAAYYQKDDINSYPVHRFPDLARLEEHQEKILKAFGEGRDAERYVTDVTLDDGGGVNDQVLTCPHTVIAFIASDNENVDLDDYPELRNRALTLSVDASEEQTKRVNERKARERAGMEPTRIDPMRRAQIQDYHSSVPVDEWTREPGNQILNPAAIEIHDQEPIPEKFPEARQDFDRLLEFMETVSLYHYTQRLVSETDRGRVMLVTPEDIWLAMTILGNKMVMSALNLTKEDQAILDLLEESHSNLSKAQIQQQLRAQGYHVSDRDVKRSLKSMREKGYVREFQSNPNEYAVSEFASVTRHEVGLDYGDIAEAAADTVGNVVEEDAADAYRATFCRGNGLMSTHPFTGRAVDITEDDTLEQMLDTGIRGLQESLGKEDNDDEQEGEAAQATL